MDDLSLALKLLNKENTIEKTSEIVNPSTASMAYMIAVTSSSGGQVVLMDEVENSSEWEYGDYIEVDDEGNFDEFEPEDDPLEDIDDSIVDMTDGDGADIEGEYGQSTAFTVSEYQAKARELYAEEVESTEDNLSGENDTVTSDIDDGDAVDLPDVGTIDEDDLTGEDDSIGEMTDSDYSLVDDESNDESEEPIEGAETSDGYTVAECIGTINAGDRVAVMIQDGKITVLGVVGSGDEQRAMTEDATATAEEAQAAADSSRELAESANESANNAEKSASEASEKAKDAAEKVDNLNKVVEPIKKDFESIKGEEETFKAGLEKVMDSTASAKFATKKELVEVKSELNSAIRQTASRIEITVTEDQIKDLSPEAETAVEQARTIYINALTQYQEAQKAYELAVSEKVAAETTIAKSLISLNDLKVKVAEILNSENASDDLKAEVEAIQADAQADYNKAVENVAKVNSVVENCLNDLNKSKSILDSAHNKLNECVDSKTMTKAQFNVEAEKIESSVKKTIDNIKIGGRNLLQGTKDEWQEINATQWYCRIYEYPNEFNPISDFGLEVGDTITYSIMLNGGQHGAYARITTYSDASGANENLECGAKIPAGEVGLSYVTFTLTQAMSCMSIDIQNGNAAQTSNLVQYKCPKLEKSNKQSDWTPSPEDMATSEELDSATTDLDNKYNERVAIAESLIQQLSDAISMIVVDENGGTLLEQTSEGWTFSVVDTINGLKKVTDDLKELSGNVGDQSDALSRLDGAVKDLQNLNSYISIDVSGDKPKMIFGNGSEFKQVQTNEDTTFYSGSTKQASIGKDGLSIKKAIIEDGIDFGSFMIVESSDGTRLGFVYKGE